MTDRNPYGRQVDVQLGWENGRLRQPDEQELEQLQQMTRRVRRHILHMVHTAGAGHAGGPLSATDILVTLYFWVLRVDPLRPRWPERDRLVLSKGHASPGMYAVLAERGFLRVDRLTTYFELDTEMQGHPDRKKTPGIEISAGPLGMGLSVAVGMALGARLDEVDCRIYALLSDGENQAGMTWEAAMLAGVRHLGNLTAIVDYNKLQLSDFIEDMVDVAPLADKWRAFNWHVVEIDGHDIRQIVAGINKGLDETDRPTVLIAHTVKGKGISYMENVPKWHYGGPTDEELAIGLEELADPETVR